MEIFETQKLVNVKGVAPYSLSLQCDFFFLSVETLYLFILIHN